MSVVRIPSENASASDPSGKTQPPPGESGDFQGRPRIHISERMLADLLTAAEFGWIVLASCIAQWAYLTISLREVTSEALPYVAVGMAGAGIAVATFRFASLYTRKSILDWRGSSRQLLPSLGFAFLALLGMAFMLKVSSDYSRGWFTNWAALSLLGLIGLRYVASRSFAWMAKTGLTARRVVVVADVDGADLRRLLNSLRSEGGLELVGAFSSHVVTNKLLQPKGALATLLQSGGVDDVVVVSGQSSRTEAITAQLATFNVDVWVHPHELVGPILGFETIGNSSLLLIAPRPMREWGRLVKASLDYGLAAILLVLLAPLFAVIAAAIRFESKGPVFFRQSRHGLNHRIIEVYKFRTMIVCENGPTVTQARKNDERVTCIGRLLRSTSLDELPQLINVLKGEMSIVGPRPHAIAHNEFYVDIVQRYANRHRVKPGITGLAQISGYRGPTDDPEKMRQRVRKDLEYIAGWSIWMDLKILALTAFRGFVHPNAY